MNEPGSDADIQERLQSIVDGDAAKLAHAINKGDTDAVLVQMEELSVFGDEHQAKVWAGARKRLSWHFNTGQPI